MPSRPRSRSPVKRRKQKAPVSSRPFVCDRAAFIALSLDTLLQRGPKGNVIVGDALDAYDTMAAHDRGEPVVLLPSYTIVQNGVERIPTKQDRERILSRLFPKLPGGAV